MATTDPNAPLISALNSLAGRIVELNQFLAPQQEASPVSSGANAPNAIAIAARAKKLGATPSVSDPAQVAADVKSPIRNANNSTTAPSSISTAATTAAAIWANSQARPQWQRPAQSNSANTPGFNNNSLSSIAEVANLFALNEPGMPSILHNWLKKRYTIESSLNAANKVAQTMQNYQPAPISPFDPVVTQILSPGKSLFGNPNGPKAKILGAIDSLNGFMGRGMNQAGSLLSKVVQTDAAGNITGALGMSTATLTGIGVALEGANIVNNFLGNQAKMGQQFGYGPGAFGNAFLGMRLPTVDISAAQRVGMGFLGEKNYLTGWTANNFGSGAGLTGGQASSVLNTLASQGFSMNQAWQPFFGNFTGDAATIANGFMAPLMSKMPGLSAQTLGQFTPAMRNTATSADQLASALSNVATQSQAAKETVNTYTDQVAQSAQAFAAMGASFAAAIGTSTAFTQSTGLSPTVGSTLAQNPIVQGLALGQGVLPSGIGNMGGAFGGVTEQAVKLLQQGLQGINYNTYKTKDGASIMTRNGTMMMASQVASMLGISQSEALRMMGSSTRYSNVANATAVLGNSTTQSGLYYNYEAMLNARSHGDKAAAARDQQALQHAWQVFANPALREAGVSAAHIKALSHNMNFGQRFHQANAYLSAIGGGGQFNKINQTNVQIGLTPQAAKLLQISVGPSGSKLTSNSGGVNISTAVNSPTHDISFNGLGRAGLGRAGALIHTPSA